MFANIMIFKTFDSLNQSKYFAGIMMLVLNLGSKYITMELSESQDELLKNKIIRRFLVFTVVFVATRDILVSLILTGIFIILVSGLFNENSSYSIVTKPVISNVTDDEYRQALKIVKSYDFQKKTLNNSYEHKK
jgi:hypothetical protein